MTDDQLLKQLLKEEREQTRKETAEEIFEKIEEIACLFTGYINVDSNDYEELKRKFQ